MFLKLKNKFNDWPIAIRVTLWYTILMTVAFVIFAGALWGVTDGLKQYQTRTIMENRLQNEFGKHNGQGLGQQKHLRGGMSGQGCRGRLIPGNSGYVIVDENDNIVAQEQLSEEANQRLTLLAIFIVMPFFILFTALGGYKIIKHGLAPLVIINSTARDIGEKEDLSRRIEIGPGKDEIHQTACEFNSMLEQIEASVEREKRFSSDVSHELRTPVAVIRGESEYGLKYMAANEELQESFGVILAQSKLMTDLINQLLDLAKVNNGRDIAMEQVDFSKLTREVAADYEMLAESKGLQFGSQVEDGLEVTGNVNLLRCLLTNYLDNALKFTSSKVEIKVQHNGDRVQVAVTDDGAGIPPDEQAKIWNRLYQTEASRNHDANKGLGLGLAFVAQVARLHKGRVWVESLPGQGSSFFLELNI